ncbi:hypothetical protein CCZ01_06665 [Helicobacter monodelphidis]|uniref:Type II toxin-antitoxin system antitoxin, RelB/DinJ family n=1 Tax=Helicobacter didelphidarum TaxID=2040648 RepID=A0A3D8IL24_9HELI|nr:MULTISPECIES: type II toxin-antitoxin system RelB/DinJ family antitoxin [Helicobacter]RAX57255.1 hypothetical protein CCZ01_06665 [Helicobacter sp. 15-1451]RDU65271.1 type II toxin-antitoxin system antitoxin, RelB/DinJ family [Helicobacter didelphidarum]
MTTLVQVKVDKELKEEADKLFHALGLDTTTALRMFLKTAVREQKIPLNLTLNKSKQDPFYSKENIAEIKQRIEELDSGKVKPIIKSIEELEALQKEVMNA